MLLLLVLSGVVCCGVVGVVAADVAVDVAVAVAVAGVAVVGVVVCVFE